MAVQTGKKPKTLEPPEKTKKNTKMARKASVQGQHVPRRDGDRGLTKWLQIGDSSPTQVVECNTLSTVSLRCSFTR